MNAKKLKNMNKKTLVIGASSNPERYSNMAMNSLVNKGHAIETLGKKPDWVMDKAIETEPKAYQDIDTITLYINKMNQKPYYDYMVSLKPKRVIFNPGAENDELAQILIKNNIKAVEACTLVMLSTGQF